MNPLEQFIVRHKPARYAFVLITFPFVAIKDRVKGIWNPVDLHALKTALRWAREGGDPAKAIERPEPAPVHPKWQGPA
jgi:hypothetical protein